MKILVIGGPTASGKSKAALEIAKKTPAVIINADSMQVYEEIPILSDQPSQEVQAQTPHALYGFMSYRESCSAGRWAELAAAEITKAHANKRLPILVGGTGLYIQSLMQGISPIPEVDQAMRKAAEAKLKEVGHAAFHALLAARDPEIAARLKPGDTQRMTRAWEMLEQTGKSLAYWHTLTPKKYLPAAQFSGFFIHPPREKLYAIINQRFEHMLETGAVEEVKKLLAFEVPAAHPMMKALGVPEIAAYLKGKKTREEAIAKAQQMSRNYAKRQITWFKNQLSELKEVDSADAISLSD